MDIFFTKVRGSVVISKLSTFKKFPNFCLILGGGQLFSLTLKKSTLSLGEEGQGYFGLFPIFGHFFFFWGGDFPKQMSNVKANESIHLKVFHYFCDYKTLHSTNI